MAGSLVGVRGSGISGVGWGSCKLICMGTVGVEQSVALQSAKEVTKVHLHELDVVDLHKEALKLALQKQRKVTSEATAQRSKRTSKVLPTAPHDLRVIVTQGKKKKLPAYDSLRASGYIKDPLEFLG